MESVTNFTFLGLKITVDSDCNHEIKRSLILRRKAMTKLDSILKSRDTESRDTISLFTTELSYSPQQTEVLIDRYSLCYVSDVQFDKSGHAIVDMLLLPRNLYENA